jgi:hypothetical protein
VKDKITFKETDFSQEDAPSEVGEATGRFVAKGLAGKIS